MRPGPLGTDLEQRGAIIDRLRATLRTRHYSPRTEKAYVGWASRFFAFCEPAKVEALDTADVSRFLTHLATRVRVSASTQNQAFSALLFLLQEALGRELANLKDVVPARPQTGWPGCPLPGRRPLRAVVRRGPERGAEPVCV